MGNCRHIFFEWKISKEEEKNLFINDFKCSKKYLVKAFVYKKLDGENLYCRAEITINSSAIFNNIVEAVTNELINYMENSILTDDAVSIFQNIIEIISKNIESIGTRGVKAEIFDSGGKFSTQKVMLTYYG